MCSPKIVILIFTMSEAYAQNKGEWEGFITVYKTLKSIQRDSFC